MQNRLANKIAVVREMKQSFVVAVKNEFHTLQDIIILQEQNIFLLLYRISN